MQFTTMNESSKKSWIKVVGIWLFSLALALILLIGRFNWTSHLDAVRGYSTSVFMLIFFLYSAYYLLRELCPGFPKLALGVTIFLGVLHTLPYHWLGLERFFYKVPDIRMTGFHNNYSMDHFWFPQGLLHPVASMPHECGFFVTLALLGIIIAGICYSRLSAGDPRRYRVFLWLGIYLLILVSAWMHLSFRSPYTYTTHYEEAPKNQKWYVNYLFPNQQGAVNADYPIFRELDELFMGHPVPTILYLLRRSFIHYVTGQWSYFISPFYVFLVFNIGFWLAACACMYGYARSFFSREVAWYATFLTACGSGFIYFVGQPMSYLPGYACVIVLLYLFERFFVQTRATWHKFILFGCIAGLLSMVYDILPWYVFYVAYAIIRRVSLKGTILSLAIAVLIYAAFIYMMTKKLGFQATDDNTKFISQAAANLIALLKNRNFNQFYILSLSFFRKFLGHIANATLFVPAVLAIVGTFTLRQRKFAFAGMLLLIPPMMGIAFLHFGNVWIADLPRLAYVVYPCIYLLAANALMEIRTVLARLKYPKIGIISVASLLLISLVSTNIDVFGHPVIYIMFYFQECGPWPWFPK